MEKKSNNTLYLVSGCSGSGKTTIMRSVMANEITSFTTREPRENEINGVDYIFLTQIEFDWLLNNDGLVEYTNYDGNNYGITRSELYSKLSKDDAFAIVDFNGMKQLKRLYDKCETIFIYCTKEDAEKHMRIRGSSQEMIDKRMSTYESEIENLYYYDYVLENKNGYLDEAISIVKDIIGGFE
jgi:guanylate kinase